MAVPLKFKICDPAHEVAYQELVKLLHKHGDKIGAAEMLAIAANMIGKLIALQDQRVITNDMAMEIVGSNIELGNQQAIAQMNSPAGSA